MITPNRTDVLNKAPLMQLVYTSLPLVHTVPKPIGTSAFHHCCTMNTRASSCLHHTHNIIKFLGLDHHWFAQWLQLFQKLIMHVYSLLIPKFFLYLDSTSIEAEDSLVFLFLDKTCSHHTLPNDTVHHLHVKTVGSRCCFRILTTKDVLPSHADIFTGSAL